MPARKYPTLAQSIGMTYSRLTILCASQPVVSRGRKLPTVKCKCACGRKYSGLLIEIQRGRVKSCGYLVPEAVAKSATVHGEARDDKHTPEYRCWKGMKARCSNPKKKGFERYGGRGISVSPLWINDFPAFLAHVGRKPSPAHSLDRIDNDGNYVPGNVRWATKKEQRANQSRVST